MKVFELLPRPLGNIFRKLTHFTCNSPSADQIVAVLLCAIPTPASTLRGFPTLSTAVTSRHGNVLNAIIRARWEDCLKLDSSCRQTILLHLWEK